MELTVTVENNCTAPSIAISMTKGAIDIHLEEAILRALPSLHNATLDPWGLGMNVLPLCLRVPCSGS
jgi:hypothetical protein